MIKIENDNLQNSLVDLKIQLVLNKRLYKIEKIPKDLYERVEISILSKIQKVESKLKLLNYN